ncbi:hypothetical protein Prede_2587 [Prevotella dentalis DSM 3688]|uniref:Uncharacterized protein n=1 Tax=Prevotella dentalis (strain ATCC 49559 / DSM 3688 / JCM 13448 / NCTC 12043 / ES 2772) TaxID=908937 RepID=F9D791_PREDD|nr:hypothetical protein [Prevotella dentalis]AGB29747.1 hypothetical protein Prede_2502 [Prevotella dentalis DSM 3688]AGB29822.1 hypothetical protein Prede_2587 [Prevotella dentalis DSM 3688]EGQ11457.1 hypothetical protein HMPREF9136_2719 [Prevotella dentalis DSM 3688]
MENKNLKRTVLTVMAALMLNAVMGAIIGTAVFGFHPVAGVIVANLIALAVGAFLPKDSLCEGVLTEIWTGEMVKAFRSAPESLGWYDRIKSYDQYVDNDVIHFTELGGDPDVLVNNTTYPLQIQDLKDSDKPISLDKYDTTATPVTDDELHACSYDKMASVQERHREALKEKCCQKAIHAIAPDSDTTDTPVLLTTGAASSDGTHKLFTTGDLLAMKKRFDKMGIPKNDRIAVLCSEHINDLLETDLKFKDHYNINQTEGKIARLYGFDIYEYDGTPMYNVAAKTKNVWGAVASSATDRQASVFYYNGRMMKANGSVQFYYSEASKDPLYHRNLVNFRKWGICLPLTSKNSRGVIVSALTA